MPALRTSRLAPLDGSHGHTPKALARAIEGLVTGAGAAALAWVFLYPLEVHSVALHRAGAAVAGFNGLVSGAVGIYAWRRVQGWLCFLSDSTWGLVGVLSGLALHVANLLHRNPAYLAEMSLRSNRHVYEGGFSARAGFVLALGNVVSAGGGAVGLRGDSPGAVRRRRLVDVHEGTHLLQNRLLGPIYTSVYLGWMLLAGAAGLVVGILTDRSSLWRVVETFAYYDNPFEYWAYRKDGYWPPLGAHPRYVWTPGRSR